MVLCDDARAAGGHTRPEKRPDVADRGCATGVPVVRGEAAMELTSQKALVALAMRCIQQDDYHGIMEFARNQLQHALATKQRCSFSMTLRPERVAATSLPTMLDVSSANMLHYAVCIRSFSAAAALVLVNPKLVRGVCRVMLSFSEDSEHATASREETWSATDLAALFCVLYGEETAEGSDPDGEADAEVRATYDAFNNGRRILELAESRPELIPILNLRTVDERVAAAGPFAEEAIQALQARPEPDIPPQLTSVEDESDELERLLARRHCERPAKVRAHFARKDMALNRHAERAGRAHSEATASTNALFACEEGRLTAQICHHMQSAMGFTFRDDELTSRPRHPRPSLSHRLRAATALQRGAVSPG